MRPKKELIPIDGEKLRQILWDKGLHSYEEQAEALGTNERRLRQAIRGGAFQQATIVRWCEKLDSPVKDILLETSIIGRMGARNGEHRVVGDWQADMELSRWIESTNGLQYRIFRLSHRHMNDGRLARGKLYDMGGFSDADRDDLAQLLERHPLVCQTIGQHPNIASNLTALPDQNGRDWWVVDRWVAGRTLKQVLADGTLSMDALPAVMRGIGEGLACLHQHGYLRRELSPKFIILDEKTNTPVLTDFELAKLLSGGSTVAHEADWKHVDDGYRAPEVAANCPDLGPEIDVYSWGRILLRAATGELPAAGSPQEDAAIKKLPKAIGELAKASVQIDRTKRPQSMDVVLRAIKRWK